MNIIEINNQYYQVEAFSFERENVTLSSASVVNTATQKAIQTLALSHIRAHGLTLSGHEVIYIQDKGLKEYPNAYTPHDHTLLEEERQDFWHDAQTAADLWEQIKTRVYSTIPSTVMPERPPSPERETPALPDYTNSPLYPYYLRHKRPEETFEEFRDNIHNMPERVIRLTPINNSGSSHSYTPPSRSDSRL